jgi:hypothetical protein
MAKKTAIVKASGAELVQREDWELEAAQEAKEQAAQFQTGIARISHKSATFRIDGQAVEGNRFVAAVLSMVKAKNYWAEEYDADVAATPSCYSFHPTSEAEMVPHSAAPDKQSERCATCPHNAFGTAERGNGKRCKDEVRLMLVVPDKVGGLGSENRMLSVPAGSFKNWSAYLTKLRDMGLSIHAVITEFGVVPAEKAYKLTFNFTSKLTGEQYMALKTHRESAMTDSMQPYPVLAADERPRRPKKKVKGQD